MTELSSLAPIGRKLWVKKKWDEYVGSKNYRAIVKATELYYNPTKDKYTMQGEELTEKPKIAKPKWRTAVDRKVDYLLARKPVCKDHQELLDSLLDFIRESTTQLILRGSLVWIVQGDGQAIDPRPLIMQNTMVVYSDEFKEEPVAYIRKRIDVEIDNLTGAETEVEYFECYYQSGEAWKRDTYCYSKTENDEEETLSQAPVFIELDKTGDAPLFAYVEDLLIAFDHVLEHQDRTVVKNTTPLTEVRGYTGTPQEDIDYAVNTANIVKVDGNGGVAIHSRSMDSSAIDLWVRRIMQEWYESTRTVGKDDELAYAQSGKAMDRLFIDMENSARQLAHTLEVALQQYFEVLGITDANIVWNTDRPVDDAAIINAIAASRGLVSDETLLEQHPWVDDVEEEKKRIEAQQAAGFEDLMEQRGQEEDEDGLFGSN